MLATFDRARETLFDAASGEPTLDEVLVDVWEGLAAHRAVPCPVCGGELEPQYGTRSLPIGGRCASCGSTIS